MTIAQFIEAVQKMELHPDMEIVVQHPHSSRLGHARLTTIKHEAEDYLLVEES